ncbi:ABC transporter substrate-binding protein [Chloroflexota bacterium]
MKMNRLTIFLVALLVFTIGCAAPAAPVGGNFIEGVSAGEAETLNYILAVDSASHSYAGFTLGSLATYNNQYEVILRHLAKLVEASEDGLTYTMTIRDDLKWSDGKKVTAEDYVYTLKNLMFPDWLNYPYKSDWQETVDGETVFVEPEVVNETTFVIRRQTVDPEFLDNAIYGFTPYPKHIAIKYEGDVEAFTQAEEFNNLTYTGNLGPYKFKEWIRNDKYVVERNPDFYLGKDKGAPYFEQYITKLLGTPAAVHAALEAGDITYAGIDPEHVAKFKQMEGIKVYTVPTSGYQLITYNLRNNGWEGFKSKGVRQALSMSINKKAVIDSILLGFGDPAFSFIPKPSPWYTEEGVPKYGIDSLYDKEKTKQMLYEAGYGVKKADGTIMVQNKDGKPIKLTLATNSGNKLREDIAFLVKQELVDIGMEVDIKLVPWATLLRQYMYNKVPGTEQAPRANNGPDAVSEQPWDLMVMGFSTHPIAPSGSRVFFTSDGGLNYWGYSNPKVDELFQRVRSREALDKEVRKKMYAEISQIIAEDQAVDFLSFPRANHTFQANVEGIDEGMRMGWNYHEWFFATP